MSCRCGVAGTRCGVRQLSSKVPNSCRCASAHRMRAPSREPRSAACSRSSSACSCAIRVNWMRNSRSALARRCSTDDTDWAVERRSNRAGEAGRGDSDRNLSGAMTHLQSRTVWPEGGPMAVLNRTPSRALHFRHLAWFVHGWIPGASPPVPPGHHRGTRRLDPYHSRRVPPGTLTLTSDARTSYAPLRTSSVRRSEYAAVGGFHE